MTADQGGTVLEPGGGRTLSYPRGGRMELKAQAADTGGAYAMLEFTIPPGGTGSPPHYHLAMEEAFYVLDGELLFTLDDDTVRMTTGAFVIVPRGVVHTFVNSGSRPTRCLILVSPADFEGYFIELSELASATDGSLAAEAMVQVANTYGQVFVEPPRGQ